MTIVAAALARVRSGFGRRAALLGQVGWVSGSFAVQQVLRLASNVALAWLLAPALLGTMLLINTLRTGGELLSDVGVGQSIVHNKRGLEPVFLDTAWTIKIIRGLILFAVAWAASSAIAGLYDEPELARLLPIAAGIFIVSGFASPSRYVLQKRLEVKRLALFDLGVSVVSVVIHIVLALITPTIWALIGGLLLSGLVSSLGSFFLVPELRHRLRLERLAFREIVHFGKWIFVASLVYFLAMNFDRLYLADAIPFAMLGIYGIARTFSDTITQIFQRMGNLLIFPRIAAAEERGAELRRKISPLRRMIVLATAGALAVAVCFADVFVEIAYDDRYLSAGIFLTILLLGTWFAVLGQMADAMIMGVGKPASVATSNLAKLALIAALMPFLLSHVGIVPALFGFVAGEAARYLVLVWRKRALGLGFMRQDAAATVLFVILALALREATGLIGLTGGIEGWLAAARIAHV